VLLTGFMVGGRKHLLKYLTAFAPGVLSVALCVSFPIIDLVLLAEDTLLTSLLRPAIFSVTKRVVLALRYKTYDLVPCVDAKLLGLVDASVIVAVLSNRAVSGIASWSALGVFLVFDTVSFGFRCWVHSDFLCMYYAQSAAGGSVAASEDGAAGPVGLSGTVCWTLQAKPEPNGAPRTVRPLLLKRLVRAWPDAPVGTSERLISTLVLNFEGEIQGAVYLHSLIVMFPLMHIEAIGLTNHPLAAFWFPKGATTGLFLFIMFTVNTVQAVCIRLMYQLRAGADSESKMRLRQQWTSRKKFISFAGACWCGAFSPMCANWVVYWALQLKGPALVTLGVHLGTLGSNNTNLTAR
jgi:hypothetical protein